MAAKRSLVMALFTAAAIGGIVSCGGGGGGGGTTETTETQLVNNATQEEVQAETATVTGTLPEDVQLADDADVRAVEGVADVVAICGGQTIDGYFTNGGKNFVVEVPVNQECIIAFVDRKITEGSNLPEDAKILAATPPIEVEKPGQVQIQITAIDNGIAQVQAPQDVVEVGNPEIVQNLVDKPLSEAVAVVQSQEEQQTEQISEVNTNQTAPVSAAYGNVDVGWLDKRVVGYAVDKVVNILKDGNISKELNIANIPNDLNGKKFVQIGNTIYFVDNSTNELNAISLADKNNPQRVTVSLKDNAGNTLYVSATGFIFGDTTLWFENNSTDDRNIYVAKLIDITNPQSTIELTAYKTGLENINNYQVKGDTLYTETPTRDNRIEKAYLSQDGVVVTYIDSTRLAKAQYIENNPDDILIWLTDNGLIYKPDKTQQQLPANGNGTIYLVKWNDETKEWSVSSALNLNDLDWNLDNGTRVGLGNIQDVTALGYMKNDLLTAFIWTDNTTDNNTSYTLVVLSDKNTVQDIKTLYTDYSVNSTNGLTFNRGDIIAVNLQQDKYAIFNTLNRATSTNSTLTGVIAFLTHQTDGSIEVVAKGDNSTIGNIVGENQNYTIDNLTEIYPVNNADNMIIGELSNGTINDIALFAINSGGNVGLPSNKTLLNVTDKLNNDVTKVTTAYDSQDQQIYLFATNNTDTVRVPIDYTQGWITDKIANIDAGLYRVVDANRVFTDNGALYIYDKAQAKFVEKQYNDQSAARGIDGLHFDNNTIYYLTLKADDNPYFNRVEIVDVANGIYVGNGIVLIAGNNTETDQIAYLNLNDITDAQYVSQVLTDKTINQIFASGNYIYAVDNNGNLYIVENDNGIAKVLASKYIGTVQDVVAKEDGSSIYVVSDQGFLYVLDKDGNQKQSFQIKVDKQLDPNLDSVDQEIYPDDVRLGYAGNYVYAVAAFRNKEALAGQNITNKDYGYILIYKVREDGTLDSTPVGVVKLFDTTQNAGSATINFAKVVGEKENAKLYTGFRRAGISVISSWDLSNPENIRLITEKELNLNNVVFSSQAIYAYENATVQKYILPTLTPTVTVDISDTKYIDTINNQTQTYGFGNYLFANNGNRIAIMDLTDIQNIRLAGDVNIGDIGLNNINDIYVKSIEGKTYLYVGTNKGLVIYDLNPETLK
jgi:hypothetical protein